MQNWIGGWGYRVTDFGLFPLIVENETQRIVIKHNVYAKKVRVEFSNHYGRHPLPITHATIACVKYNGEILCDSSMTITFDGSESVVLKPGEVRYCDEIDFITKPEEKIAVSVYIQPRTVITGACSSQSKILTNVKNISGGDYCTQPDFDSYDQHEHFVDFLSEKPLYTCFYGVSEVEFLTEKETHTVVAFGDSLTQQGHWSEAFSELLYCRVPGEVTVLNRGICGNRVLHDASTKGYFGNYFGPSGVERFEGDVFLNHDTPVDSVIVLEGVNDLIQPRVLVPEYEMVTVEQIIEGYRKYEKIAHQHGASIYIGTLLPYRGYMDAWCKEDEEKRQRLNEWIRGGDHDFDGVIDFEKAVCNPEYPDRLLETIQCGDRLHPNADGGAEMAKMIQLENFINLKDKRGGTFETK